MTGSTPTDVLIKSMENAEDMTEIVVLFRRATEVGVGWASNLPELKDRFALIAEIGMSMFAKHYGLIQNSEED